MEMKPGEAAPETTLLRSGRDQQQLLERYHAANAILIFILYKKHSRKKMEERGINMLLLRGSVRTGLRGSDLRETGAERPILIPILAYTVIHFY